MALKQKLMQILESRFPAPDKVNLRFDDGIIGIVTSKQFRNMDLMQRQDAIHELLEANLTPKERRKVLIIVAVTPEEEKARAAMGE